MSDEVYRERAQLVALLAAVYPSHLWVPSREPKDDEDWPVIYLHTPVGQLSWHINRTDLDLFGHVDIDWHRAPEDVWDGHDTPEKYRRVRELTTKLHAKHWPTTPPPS